MRPVGRLGMGPGSPCIAGQPEVALEFSFLICSERSGSNLITRMLDGHSRICGPATKHLLNPVARNLFRYEPLTDPGRWQALLADVHALLDADFSCWRTRFSIDDLAELAAPGDVDGLVRAIFGREAASHGKTHVFVKENHVHEFIAFLLLRFPTARFVYQVRDPRDMALSWRENPGHPGGVCRAARQWQADQQQGLKLHHELGRLGRSVLLRYEDLIREPERALGGVLALLHLDYEPAMLAYHENALTRANAGRQHAWSNLDKSVMRDNMNKYRQGLSGEELLAVEAICRHEMRVLGYVPDHEDGELERFAREALPAFEQRDTEAKRHVVPPAVQANIAAKARFYRQRPLPA